MIKINIFPTKLPCMWLTIHHFECNAKVLLGIGLWDYNVELYLLKFTWNIKYREKRFGPLFVINVSDKIYHYVNLKNKKFEKSFRNKSYNFTNITIVFSSVIKSIWHQPQRVLSWWDIFVASLLINLPSENTFRWCQILFITLLQILLMLIYTNLMWINSNNCSSLNINMDTKTCPRCNVNKLKSEYYKDSSKSDKLFYCCKACDKIAHSKWHKENKLYSF